jgi:cation-transporting ATPase 13A2
MKNYELLMAKVGRALKPGGKLFVHIFAHKTTPYDFEEGWMSTHFFSGGTMPSADLLHFFQKDLTLEKQWWVNGQNYAKTCEVRLFFLHTSVLLLTSSNADVIVGLAFKNERP